MKKWLSLGIIVLSIALIGSGCGKKSVATEENGTITIDWMPQNDAPVDTESPVIKELEAKFGVKFNFIYMDREKEVELLNVRIAGGEIPDVMRRNDTICESFIQQGVLTEISEDLVKEVAPTLYNKTKEYGGEDIWDAVKKDGKLYGIPIISNNGQYHMVSIWRDDWLKNVGIDKIPETLDEAEDAFYKFTRNDPDGNGIADTYGLSANGIKAVFNAFGIHPYEMLWTMGDDGKVILSAALPEMKEALTLLNKWYQDGIIDPEFITGENKGQAWSSAVTFWNGRIGYSMPGMAYHVSPPLFEGNQGSTNYVNFKKIQGDTATYDYGVPLIGPAGKSGAESWGIFGGDFVLLGRNVGTDTPKMRKILEICEELNSDFDTFVLANSGREGYEWEAGTRYHSKLDSKQSAAMGLSTNGILYLPTNFEFVKQVTEPAVTEFAEAYGNIAKEKYVNLVWGGLPSDPLYNSIVKEKIEENIIKFITGARPMSEYDAYMQELNQSGLAQLTQEANEWYAEKYQ